MMAVFLLTIAIVALCVIGLSFNVLFRKKDFPHYDVGSNEEMRKRGIRCYKDEDAALQRRAYGGIESDACKECKSYEHSSDCREA